MWEGVEKINATTAVQSASIRFLLVTNAGLIV